jgi:prepilin-type processing-associated H-X9-DG protein
MTMSYNNGLPSIVLPPDKDGLQWYQHAAYWMQLLQPDMKNYGVLRCPETVSPTMLVNQNYGANREVFTEAGLHTVSLAQIQRPADMVAIFDCGRPYLDWSQVYSGPVSSKWYLVSDPRPCPAVDTQCQADKDTRHGGSGLGVAFADGHGKFMPTSAIIRDGNMWCPNGVNPQKPNACL